VEFQIGPRELRGRSIFLNRTADTVFGLCAERDWAGVLAETLADSKDMAVGMANVHLADAPGHVGGGEGDVQARGEAVLVKLVDIIDPYGHPHPFVGSLVAVQAEGEAVGSLPAAALTTLAKEDLGDASAHGAENGRLTPVPQFLPAEFLEPGKAGVDVRNAEDRSDVSGFHGGE